MPSNFAISFWVRFARKSRNLRANPEGEFFSIIYVKLTYFRLIVKKNFTFSFVAKKIKTNDILFMAKIDIPEKKRLPRVHPWKDPKEGRLKAFAERIKFLRGKKSQTEFAREIDIPQTTLSRYEQGLNYPSEDILMKISEVCDVTLDWLLKGVGARSASKEEIKNSTDRFSMELRECHAAVGLEVIAKSLAQAWLDNPNLRESLEQAIKTLFGEKRLLILEYMKMFCPPGGETPPQYG